MQSSIDLLALLVFQSPNSGSSVLFLVIALAIVGAIADWNYHKHGGKPSSRRDRIIFWIVSLIVAGSIVLTEISGWDPYGILGYVIVPLVAWLFLAWEIGRWRMRRKYPIAKHETDQLADATPRQVAIPESDEQRIRAEVERLKKRARDLGIAKSAWELNHDLKYYAAWAVNCPEIVHPDINVLGVTRGTGERREQVQTIQANLRGKVYLFAFSERDLVYPDGERDKAGHLDVEYEGRKVMTVDCRYTYDDYAGDSWDPGDVSAFIEGPWVSELNELYSEVNRMHQSRATRGREEAKREELKKLKKDFGI